jgi:hypothetical protein
MRDSKITQIYEELRFNLKRFGFLKVIKIYVKTSSISIESFFYVLK